MAAIGLLCPASPTRITPVLVTAGAALVPAGPPMPLADAEGTALLDVGVGLPDGVAEPLVFPEPPIRVGAADVGGAEVWPGGDAAAVVRGGWVVAGAVVGAAPPAVTTMSTEGLPVPQSAVTVYDPGATVSAMVAVPVKFSEPMVIEADPPTNAVEWTPVSVEPFVGHTPRIETLWPGAAVPGSTIS